MRALQLVRSLEAVRTRFDETSADDKRSLLRAVKRTRFDSAKHLFRVHEALLFVRAYADDEHVQREAAALLTEFRTRRDLRNARDELEDTGIAGTTIYYRFWLTTARWLANRHPGQLHVDWDEFEHSDQLEAMLWMLVHYAEGPALEAYGYTLREWIVRLKGQHETDAEFLTARLAALDAGPFVREAVYDRLELPMRVDSGVSTPSRTTAHVPEAPVAYQHEPLQLARPDLGAALLNPPRSVRTMSGVAARRLVDVAKGCMVTRSRDLNSFMYASAKDVRLIDCGRGLGFVALGLVPEQRGLLEGVYAFVTLKNGVPMGYVLSSGLFGVAEVAYNVFPAFRGGEAGWVYGRVLSMIHALLGATVFAVDPYQLGHGNEEGLSSGAWWFYYKLGFRPRDPEVRRVLRRELSVMKRNPRHRSTRDTLMQLSAAPMYYEAAPQPDDAVGHVDGISLAVSDYLAKRFGAERERGARLCAQEAAALLDCAGWTRWRPGERLAFRRWAPVVCALPGVSRWSPANRRAFAQVIRAKGGARESDFVRKFDAHRPLRRALLRMAEQADATA